MVVPIFKNASQEPAIEVDFTNRLIQEFERSKVARVTERSEAQIVLEGRIASVTYTHGGPSPILDGVILTNSYTINIIVNIQLIRASDRKILWTGDFKGERTYSPPFVTLPGVNSVNPLYNLSARRQNINIMAQTMMAEAHDRITENF